MLKNITLLLLITLTSPIFASEYEVVITDEVTGEKLVQNNANESDIKTAKQYVQSLNDSFVSITIKKKEIPMSVFAIKMKGGGEGGGD